MSLDPRRTMRTDSRRKFCAWMLVILLAWIPASAARAQEPPRNIPPNSAAPISLQNPTPAVTNPTAPPTFNIPEMTKRENFSAGLQLIILLTVLSLAPAILIMMTSFTRIVIVLALLRQ